MTRNPPLRAMVLAVLLSSGVIDVSTHVADVTSHMAERRARNQLQDKIRDLLWPEPKP